MTRRRRILLISLVLACAILIPACAYGYTLYQLGLGRMEGVYPSAEAGMRARIEKSYVGIQRIEIDQAGPNIIDGRYPHVWFVIARVWAEQRADGHALHPNGYDHLGSYYLKVHDGWIYRPEESFPDLIGFFMKVFHLEGNNAGL